MADDKITDKKESKGVQYVQLAVILVVLAVVAYLVISFLMKFIWWILGLLSIFVLIINYKTVFKVFGMIKNLYKKHVALGIAGTIGAFLVSTPFVGYLFLKTIWDFRKSDMVKNRKKNVPDSNASSHETIDIDATIIDMEEMTPPPIEETKTWELPPDHQQ